MLVVQAPTEVLNPKIDREEIAEAYEDDPEAARAELGAEFRTDLADFVSREVVEALVSPGSIRAAADRWCAVLRVRGSVVAASADAFTMAIAHQERDVAVVDVCSGASAAVQSGGGG